ncbi:uncharacterized protein DEA37_0014645 [Paragonimus westermani]|uniref:ESF1 RRM domain-containing protein n=1 Tax=Paragonimus westermani TaxID=34504 RepID=A0A5J4P3L1_9TREM|nr:uncharacterized protein DEA37_0014645 [Paragonimus westermani]
MPASVGRARLRAPCHIIVTLAGNFTPMVVGPCDVVSFSVFLVHITRTCLLRFDADWQELTKDAVPTTTIGRRLALLHFDWDNAKAENIYMVLESFLPARGHIERVTVRLRFFLRGNWCIHINVSVVYFFYKPVSFLLQIYPSEFGIKRLAEEAIKGPPELVDNLSDEEQEEKEPVNNHKTTKIVQQTDSTKNEQNILLNPVEVDDKAGWRKASVSMKRRIRQYQLARLKYFYAVIEFDSPETAETVYDACDGLEYESSGCRFDLRFVNDDEVFSVPPEHAHLVSECREINKAKYAPRSFETAALHSTRIGISWDKTSDERIDWLRDQFKPEADPQITLTEDRQKLEKYLALSSSGASTAASSDVDEPPPAPTVPRIRRHRPKKLPPAELRAALLGATPSDSTLDVKDDDDRPDQTCDPSDTVDHEDEEEVLDINEADILTSNESTVEDYDLGPVEKKASKAMITSSKDRKVRRLILPEAMEDMGDSSDGVESPEHQDTQKRREDKKRKRRESQKNKMLSKKRKVLERLEKQATLWPVLDGTDSQTKYDDRFDAFLTDPAFQISQAHPNYKEATEFLQYMRQRKVLLATLERSAASTESEMPVN